MNLFLLVGMKAGEIWCALIEQLSFFFFFFPVCQQTNTRHANGSGCLALCKYWAPLLIEVFTSLPSQTLPKTRGWIQSLNEPSTSQFEYLGSAYMCNQLFVCLYHSYPFTFLGSFLEKNPDVIHLPQHHGIKFLWCCGKNSISLVEIMPSG